MLLLLLAACTGAPRVDAAASFDHQVTVGATDTADTPEALAGDAGSRLGEVAEDITGEVGRTTTGDAQPSSDAPAVAPDGAGPGDAGAAVPGSWAAPVAVSAFPFVFSGDTTAAPADDADAYTPCAPSTDESGGEYVFELTLPDDLEPGTELSVWTDDTPGDAVDIDVHLLTTLSPSACVTRGDVGLAMVVDASATWYVTADTWVDASGQALAGPFTVTMEWVAPSAGGECLVNPIPECGADTLPADATVPVEPPGVGNCPPGTALVDAFCVDRWEGAIAIVNPDQSLTPWTPYATPPAGETLVALSAPGVVPQGHLSQVQAAAACAEAGKRLCTDGEWLRACQGPAAATFPYGSSLDPGVCNDDRPCHPVVQYFESGASWVWSELNHPCINQLPDSVQLTGANEGCVTAEGAFDMMGNLHEWTAHPDGTFRGGFYKDTVVNGPGCLYATTAHSVGHWDYSTGFRCCADPL